MIHPEDLARSGFFFRPSKDDSGKLQSDSVKCVYCNRITPGLKSCRSKTKDRLETMENVLALHILADEKLCLLTYLKLKILRDLKLNQGMSNWQNDLHFKQPFTKGVYDLFLKTYTNNTPGFATNNSIANKMARAGFIRYDPSYSAYKSILPNYNELSKTHLLLYCVYCKTIYPIRLETGHISSRNEIVEHFQKCNQKCYFFKVMKTLRPNIDLTEEFLEEFQNDYGAEISRDDAKDIEHSALDNEEEDNTSSNSVIRHKALFENPTSEIKDDDYVGSQEQEKEGHVSERGRSTNPQLKFKDNTLRSPSSSPTRIKRRKLLQSSPRRLSSTNLSADSQELSASSEEKELKQVTIKIREHVERKKSEVQRSNKLLDNDGDSDMFSFSAHGHSTFDIPVQNTQQLLPLSVTPSNPPSETKDIKKLEKQKRKSSQEKTPSNTIFSENRVTLVPKPVDYRGESSPEFVTALSAVHPVYGTPSRKDVSTPHQTRNPVFEPSNNKSGTSVSSTPHRMDQMNNEHNYLDEFEDGPELDVEGPSLPNSLVLNNSNNSKADVNISESSKRLSHISDIVLSSSSDSSSSQSSVLSTPVASPQHNIKSTIGSVRKSTNRRLRHL